VLPYLKNLRRVETPDYRPYPPAEAIARTLYLLGLSPAEDPPGLLSSRSSFQFARSADDFLTRGQVPHAQVMYAEALPLIERATFFDTGSVGAWCDLAFTLDDLQRYAKALAAFDQALALDPNDVDGWSHRCGALRSLNRGEEALIAVDHALSLHPDDPVAWHVKGNTLVDLKRYAEVLEAYR
jgi:tetratricopeptide (TPR) repeat protein